MNTVLEKKLYPFRGKYFEQAGIKQHYLDEGSGSPVVMLHGNPSWSVYYRNLVKVLSERYRCIVPDHIGCGYSDKPDDSVYRYTLEQRVKDLEKLLDHLGLEKNITLIVHDWGGMIGFRYATLYPEKISRLVVLNTAAFHLPKAKKFPFALWLAKNTKIGEFLILRFNAFSRGAASIGCKRNKMSADLQNLYTSPYDTPKNRISTLRFVQDIPLKPEEPAYKIVSEVESGLSLLKEKPILICWGEKDFVFDRHFLQEWKKYFPQAQSKSFPDCGHYILEDAPEEIIDLINEFFEKNPVKE